MNTDESYHLIVLKVPLEQVSAIVPVMVSRPSIQKDVSVYLHHESDISLTQT